MKNTYTAGIPEQNKVQFELLAYQVDENGLTAEIAAQKIMMILMKDVLPLTRYIRGGVSTIGVGKKFTTYVDESALVHQNICVSAGVQGLQMLLSPKDLIRITSSKTGLISN